MVKVAKFGGSSLCDAEHFSLVKKIVLDDPDIAHIVVSAPCSGVFISSLGILASGPDVCSRVIKTSLVLVVTQGKHKENAYKNLSSGKKLEKYLTS